MTNTRLSVRLPEGQWKRDVTGEHPETVISFPSMVLSEAHAIEVVVLSGETADPCLWAIRDHPAVLDSTVICRDSERTIVQIETTDSVLLSAAKQAGTPLSFPVTLWDGKLLVDLLSTRERISALGDHLDTDGVHFEVVHIRDDHGIRDLLTERQREVVAAAVNCGYYETPRTCSLTELADELGIAKSTCSGTLQRAEEAIINHFFTDHSPAETEHATVALASREVEH